MFLLFLSLCFCLDNRTWGSTLLSEDKKKAAAKTANKERSAEAASQPGEGVKGNKSFIEAQKIPDPSNLIVQTTDDEDDDTEDSSDSSSESQEAESEVEVDSPPPLKRKKTSDNKAGGYSL